MTTKNPVGTQGLPYIGDALAIFSDPYGYAAKRFARYGAISKTRFLGKNAAVMLSEEAAQYILVTNPHNFSNRVGYDVAYPTLGESLILTDGDFHASQRKLVTPAFHNRSLPPYLERMNTIIDAQLATWGQSGTRPLYPEIHEVAFTLASSILIGVEVGPDYDHLSHIWGELGKGMMAAVRVDAPFTTYGKGQRAKRQLNQFLRTIMNERRHTAANDATGLLLQTQDEAGNSLTEDQMLDQIRLLFFAGYDTTTGTLTWLIAELLRHPELMERVRAEVSTGDPLAPVTMDDIKQKPILDAVIKETLRLHPQIISFTRGVVETFEFAGYTIPAGWLVMVIPAFIHRLPTAFAEPDRFDPDRFLAPRAEDKAHPYAWVGFGGGPHACIGEGVAKMEIKAFMTKLLRRYDLKMGPNPDLRSTYIPLNRPKGEVPIVYTAR